MVSGGQLISVQPEELSFEFELEKPCYCNLKVVNNTEHHVAFKVKTTSPRKYFVRPNTNVVQPWDSCTITVTQKAQEAYPPDMQCKDKFLLQSIKVPPMTDVDDFTPDTFSKEGDKAIEELKLKVVYAKPSRSPNGNLNHSDNSGTSSAIEGLRGSLDNAQILKNSSIEQIQMVQRLKSERDATVSQNQQIQRELEMLKRHRSRRGDTGFSLTFAAVAGLAGLMVGFVLNFALS